MKAIEKLWMLAVCTAAWIGLWFIGPENPEDTYTTWELAVFAAVLVFCFWKAVQLWSRHYQEKNAERLKEVLKRRDARTNR